MDEFARKYNAEFTVMEGGEHWFHMPQQLSVLRKWEEAES